MSSSFSHIRTTQRESTAGNLPDMASTSTTMMASVSDMINATVTDVMTSTAAADSSTNITTTDAAAMSTSAPTDQQGVTSVLTGMMSSVSEAMNSVVNSVTTQFTTTIPTTDGRFQQSQFYSIGNLVDATRKSTMRLA